MEAPPLLREMLQMGTYSQELRISREMQDLHGRGPPGREAWHEGLPHTRYLGTPEMLQLRRAAHGILYKMRKMHAVAASIEH